MPKKVELTAIFVCGGKGCIKGGEHQWDAEVGEEFEDGGGFWSSACSKCGLSRMDYDLLNVED